MKRQKLLFIILLTFALSTSCSAEKQPDTSPINKTIENNGDQVVQNTVQADSADLREGALQIATTEKNRSISLYDINDALITDFVYFDSFTLVDNGFVYSRVNENSSTEQCMLDYYLYDNEKQEHIKLGTVEDFVYEAGYSTIYKDEHLYILIATANITSAEGQVYLCDIDLRKKSMSQHLLETGTAPYNSMAIIDGKIFIVTPGLKRSYICMYDIQTESIEVISSYEFDVKNNTGDTIRSIYSDDEYLYLLRLTMKGESDAKLFIDVMDKDFSLHCSRQLSQELVYVDSSPEFINTEIRQPVAFFQIRSNILYYENFSCTKSLYELNDNLEKGTGLLEGQHLIKPDNTISMAFAAGIRPKKDVFFETFKNNMYILDYDTNTLKQVYWEIGENRYKNKFVTCNKKGQMMILMSATKKPGQTSLPDKLYLINIDDLKDGTSKND